MKLLATVIVLTTIVYFLSSGISVKAEETPVDPTVEDNLKGAKIPSKTDDEVADREAESIHQEEFTDDELEKIKATAERHAFQAEVSRVMDIIVNSLYSNKEIFLRELISNASDALDKIRLESLTNRAALGDTPDLEIRISFDRDRHLLTIHDTGIGMTKDDLLNNLGSIATSGTKAFSQALQGDASNLIGQFGVGFYSAFLVAEKVTVITKHNDDDTQWIWESESGSEFTISPDPKGNTLGRGTKIILQMRQDEAGMRETARFVDQDTLVELIEKYSQFITFPIYMLQSRTEYREVVVDDEEGEEADEEAEDVALEEDEEEEADQEEEEEEKKEPKTETHTETVWEWVRVNKTKPLWTRSQSELTEEEYAEFYKAISNDYRDPISHIHFKAEGDVTFTALLFLPEEPPFGQFDTGAAEKGLKLYVRRVFITDDFDAVIPKYLLFVKGVVDSDDLPLNVSRETLQEHKALELIKKKVIRKAIAMIQRLADDPEAYDRFWQNFGTNIKLGVIEDTANRTRLSKLLRFVSSTTGELTSFEDYVERMKEGQDEIYYLAGNSVESLKRSPLLEGLLSNGYEVLLMTDPIDEYTMQNLSKFDSKYKLTNVGKENVKFNDTESEEDEEETSKEQEKKLKPFIKYVKSRFGDRISRVKVSNRLTTSPIALVAESWGYTATMERVVKAQALSDKRASRHWIGKKVMEVNPNHPVVQKMNGLLEEDEQAEEAADIIDLLVDSAALASGYNLEDPAAFSARVDRLLKGNLGLPFEKPQPPEPLDLDDEEEFDEFEDDEFLHEEL